jgi:hypothetical protein
LLEFLPLDIAWLVIGGVVVERVPVVGDLGGAVLPGDGAKLVRRGALAGSGLALGGERRSHLGALIVAGRAAFFVRLEQVQGPAAAVDEELAQLGAGCHGDGGGLLLSRGSALCGVLLSSSITAAPQPATRAPP